MVAAGRKKKSIAILVTRSFGKRYCDVNTVYICVCVRHTWPKWRASGGDGSPNPGIVNPSFLRVLIPTRVGGSIKIVVIHFTPFKKGQSVIKSSTSFLLLFFFFQRLFINLPNHRPRLRAFKAPLSLFLSLSSASFDIIRMKRADRLINDLWTDRRNGATRYRTRSDVFYSTRIGA